MRSTCMALLTLLLACGPAMGEIDAYSVGRQAYEVGDYGAARNHWLIAAEAGDARAEFAMGSLYDRGEGVDRSPTMASAWYLRAARNGFPPAQFNLGNAYHRGRGVPQDKAEAVHWWSAAAEAGFAPAQFNLASHYLETGVDHVAGITWLTRAAANGHSQAQALLRQHGQNPTPATPNTDPIHDPDWLLAQDPAAFTLQIAAMSSNERLQELVDSLQGVADLAWFRFSRNGQPLFVLCQGVYASADQARAAAKSLAGNRGVGDAWPRRLGDVHALIGG